MTREQGHRLEDIRAFDRANCWGKDGEIGRDLLAMVDALKSARDAGKVYQKWLEEQLHEVREERDAIAANSAAVDTTSTAQRERCVGLERHRDALAARVEKAERERDRLRQDNEELLGGYQHAHHQRERFSDESDGLRDKLAASESAREGLREALRRYGRHAEGCRIVPSEPCHCGFKAALRQDRELPNSVPANSKLASESASKTPPDPAAPKTYTTAQVDKALAIAASNSLDFCPVDWPKERLTSFLYWFGGDVIAALRHVDGEP